MSLTTRTEMSRCGHRFPTEEAAASHKRALSGSAVPVPCSLGQDHWHLAAATAAGLPKRTPASDTGFPAVVKLMIRARAGDGDPDNAVCECHGYWMGRYGGDIQHVIASGSGGTSRPEINSVRNGALMCWPGHDLAEARDPEMYERGFWRWSHETVGAAPLVMRGADGGFTRWLTADGGYSATPPGGAE
jgi:hypothetical protein